MILFTFLCLCVFYIILELFIFNGDTIIKPVITIVYNNTPFLRKKYYRSLLSYISNKERTFIYNDAFLCFYNSNKPFVPHFRNIKEVKEIVKYLSETNQLNIISDNSPFINEENISNRKCKGVWFGNNSLRTHFINACIKKIEDGKIEI